MSKNRNRYNVSVATNSNGDQMTQQQSTTEEQTSQDQELQDPQVNQEQVSQEGTSEQETAVQEQQSQVTQEVTQAVEKEIEQPALQKSSPQPSNKQPEGFTPVFKVELDLNNYAEAMDKSKAINPEEGGRWQYHLFTTIKSILNASDQETFNKEWNTVLNFFNKNKDGIFNESFIFRFPQNWPGSPQEFTMHRRVIYTLIQTANPKTRAKSLQDINMSMVTEGMTQTQRNHLNAFYNV